MSIAVPLPTPLTLSLSKGRSSLLIQVWQKKEGQPFDKLRVSEFRGLGLTPHGRKARARRSTSLRMLRQNRL